MATLQQGDSFGLNTTQRISLAASELDPTNRCRWYPFTTATTAVQHDVERDEAGGSRYCGGSSKHDQFLVMAGIKIDMTTNWTSNLHFYICVNQANLQRSTTLTDVTVRLASTLANIQEAHLPFNTF